MKKKLTIVALVVCLQVFMGCNRPVDGKYHREVIDTLRYYKRDGVCWAVISHPRRTETGLALAPMSLCDDNPETILERE